LQRHEFVCECVRLDEWINKEMKNDCNEIEAAIMKRNKWKKYLQRLRAMLECDKKWETKLLINCTNQSLVAKLQSIGDAIKLNGSISVNLFVSLHHVCNWSSLTVAVAFVSFHP
jgi:hypothetical protein